MYENLSGCVGCGLSGPSVMMVEALSSTAFNVFTKTYNYLDSGFISTVVSGLRKICPDTTYSDEGIKGVFFYYFRQANYSQSAIASSIQKSANDICSEANTKKTTSGSGTNTGTGTKPKPKPPVTPPVTGMVVCADGSWNIPGLCPENLAPQESDNTLLYVGLGLAAIVLYSILKK